MTLDTIGYLAWTATGFAFCVHPGVYLRATGAVLACGLCSAVIYQPATEK